MIYFGLLTIRHINDGFRGTDENFRCINEIITNCVLWCNGRFFFSVHLNFNDFIEFIFHSLSKKKNKKNVFQQLYTMTCYYLFVLPHLKYGLNMHDSFFQFVWNWMSLCICTTVNILNHISCGHWSLSFIPIDLFP